MHHHKLWLGRYFLFAGPLLFALGTACWAQLPEQTLSGSDVGERTPNDQRHLFGDWGGERSKLLERGINVDLLYVSDALVNVCSSRNERLADFGRVRGTVDIDFSKLTHTTGLTFHITAVYQGGGNLGSYLGTIAGPSGLASENTFRLDSYWLQKETAHNRVIGRIGQFAAQDFYGDQPFSPSFVIEPLQYAFGNLGSTTFESFDPPSSPAAELRVLPAEHVYIKAMVFSADRDPYSRNPTGLVPDFHGSAASVYEIGYGPNRDVSGVHAQDTLETRKGYRGLYQLGAAFNPGKFSSTNSTQLVSENYLIYGYASQAIYRSTPTSSHGLDVSVGGDWSPPHRSRNNQDVTVGLRFNEAFPIALHNTIQGAYIRSGINQAFPVAPPTSSTHSAEQAFELSTLIDVTHGILIQPLVQYYINTGGASHNAVVVGLHSRIDF